jgi:nucleotide-binding universal stress UspA family protein
MKKKKAINKTKDDFGRIIALVDETVESKKIGEKALFLAKEAEKDVIALYVVDTPLLTEVIPPDETSVAWETILDKQGNKTLDELEKKGKEIGVRVIKKIVEGIPDDELIKEAKKNDLIVMGCKKMSILDKLLSSSVCEKVLHHSSSPVMIYQIK